MDIREITILGGYDKFGNPENVRELTIKKGEILVGEEFWNFVASDEIYEDLLDVFQTAGEQLRDEIDRMFAKFKNIIYRKCNKKLGGFK